MKILILILIILSSVVSAKELLETQESTETQFCTRLQLMPMGKTLMPMSVGGNKHRTKTVKKYKIEDDYIREEVTYSSWSSCL